MRRRMHFGSKLILLELVVVIGFFALFSAVCLRILVSSHRISAENSKLINAVTAAQNAAECFKADYAPTLYYFKDWSPSTKGDAEYILTLDSYVFDGISTAEIIVTGKEGNSIFTLIVKDLKEEKQ